MPQWPCATYDYRIVKFDNDHALISVERTEKKIMAKFQNTREAEEFIRQMRITEYDRSNAERDQSSRQEEATP